MKYYASYDDTGKLLAIGSTSASGSIPGEITGEEYAALLEAIQAVAEYARQVYAGVMSLDDVPEQYRERVQERVEEMEAAAGQEAPGSPEVDEILDILEGVE